MKFAGFLSVRVLDTRNNRKTAADIKATISVYPTDIRMYPNVQGDKIMRVIPSKVSSMAVTCVFTVLVMLVFAAAAMAQAQATSADLSGTVVDPNNAVVAGATVTARNSAIGISRTVTSNADGSYQFIGLPPGDYEITAEAATFKKVVISREANGRTERRPDGQA